MTTICRSCGEPISPFMSFGRQPVSQVRFTADAIGDEGWYELRVAVCPKCCLFQLIDQPPPSVMFFSEYPFITSSSLFMRRHFETAAKELTKRFLSPGGRIVEIGCNDGSFLRHVAAAGIDHLGIEPAKNVAEAARRSGVSVLQEFFGEDVGKSLRRDGTADLIFAANVIAHVPDVGSVGRGVAQLLSNKGAFVFEVSYLGNVLSNRAFDLIYDEHVFTFSVLAARNVFGNCGLELFDLQPLGVHGGSMRFFLGHPGRHPIMPIVDEYIAREQKEGFDGPNIYETFATECEVVRRDLRQVIDRLNAESHTVAGYGATAKSTTILNYVGLGPNDLAFISDNTPSKIGKVSPGMHIPIVAPEKFRESGSDHVLLLAWNHRAEIEANERAFRNRGGKWILYVPRVDIQ